MPFRESLNNIMPPWLQAPNAQAIMYAPGVCLDALGQWMIEGVKASMPGLGAPDALPYLGRDRNLDRGPNETDTSFSARLSAAFDTWATAGSPVTLLQQLYVFFSPSTLTPIRLVSNGATWQTLNPATGVITTTPSAGNWTWDYQAATAWYRGWVIIDSTLGPWTQDVWSSTDSSVWGDGGTWGSNAAYSDLSYIRTIVDKWRPAGIDVPSIIITFSSSLFLATNAAGANPQGISDQPLWQTQQNAIFLGPL